MKKYFIYTLLVAFIATFSFTSCKDEGTQVDPTNAYETLTTYMESNGMDLPDVLNGWITARPADIADVPNFVSTYDIFDVRGADDYAAGHIQGAINVTYANVLEKAATTTKPILVVCYTGQSAGHFVVALRLSGYSDAKVLKWGMSGWTAANSGPWAGNSGATNGVIGVGNANWTLPASLASTGTFDSPTITTNETEGAAILAERVQTLLTEKFKGTPSQTILDNPNNYFINNYWAQTDVDHYGHISGAYRIQPLSIAGGQLSNLDASKTICTYCWTGQTSSMITAYLTVLGFNSTSLKFGANSMIYSELESHKYSVPSVDFPVVQ